MLINKIKHFENSTIFLLLLITLLIPISGFCQNNVTKITAKNNSTTIQMSFDNRYKVLDKNGKKYLSFPYSMNESKPGSPTLPSKIVYIAIPPESEANVYLSDQQYQTFSNVSIEVNPVVKKANDSTLKYENVGLQKEYFQFDQYPKNECKIKGYTWIRNYYCAIIEINPVSFNWKHNRVKLILNAKLNVEYKNVKAFSRNKTAEGPYDKILKKVILNYEYAKDFRAFRKPFNYSDTTGNWIDYLNEYVKLAVPSDGIYRITYQDLINYGLNPSGIDPNTIKIYCRGKQLPLFINQEQAGIFSSSDYIEFWAKMNYGSPDYRQIVSQGTDYLNYLNRYTDTTYIWLTWGGEYVRKIKVDSSSNLSSTDTINTYLNHQHFEKDVRLWYYDSVDPRVQLPFWQENKVWTWNVLGTNGTISQPFQAEDIVPNSTFKTYVRMISNGSDIQNGAHKVGIGINSKSILDSLSFNYKQTVNLFSTFSSGLLKDGSNTLNIMDMHTAASFQQILIDWIDIEYERYLNAINDSLYFQFPNTISKKIRVIKISNITSSNSNLLLYKVKPDTIKFTNFLITGSSSKTLTFVDTLSGGDAYILIANNYVKSPKFEIRKKFIKS